MGEAVHLVLISPTGVADLKQRYNSGLTLTFRTHVHRLAVATQMSTSRTEVGGRSLSTPPTRRGYEGDSRTRQHC